MKEDGSLKNILQRIHAAMGEVDYIQKEMKKGMNYSIVSHDAVTAKVRPVLVKHGVVYYPDELHVAQDGNRTQVQLSVRFCNIDDPEDFISVQSLGYGIDAQDKGPGKAISYAVKYALLKCLGLETGDDPDLDQSVTHEKPPPTYDRNPIVRAAFMEVYQELLKIGEMGTLDDVASFWKAKATTIKALPADWLAEITEKKDEIKANLQQRAA